MGLEKGKVARKDADGDVDMGESRDSGSSTGNKKTPETDSTQTGGKRKNPPQWTWRVAQRRGSRILTYTGIKIRFPNLRGPPSK
jgi:hypothetical protein